MTRRYPPELMERWRSADGRVPWHLVTSGNRPESRNPNSIGTVETACGLTMEPQGSRTISHLRSHWPDGACLACRDYVKQTTERIRYSDVKLRREPDAFDAIFDALVEANK